MLFCGRGSPTKRRTGAMVGTITVILGHRYKESIVQWDGGVQVEGVDPF